MNDKRHTEKEVAERFRVNQRTVRQWRTTGDGPAFIRIGKSTILYREADLVAYEDSRASGGPGIPAKAQRVMLRAAQMFEVIERWKMGDEARALIRRSRDDLRGLLGKEVV